MDGSCVECTGSSINDCASATCATGYHTYNSGSCSGTKKRQPNKNIYSCTGDSFYGVIFPVIGTFFHNDEMNLSSISLIENTRPFGLDASREWVVLYLWRFESCTVEISKMSYF